MGGVGCTDISSGMTRVGPFELVTFEQGLGDEREATQVPGRGTASAKSLR